jgi:hypothetical protein
MSMKYAMNRLLLRTASIFAVAALVTSVVPWAATAQELNISSGDHDVHIMVPPHKAAELSGRITAYLGGGAGPPLTYHGGPVMTNATTYAIYWIPSKLQNGGATGVSSNYENITEAMLSLYPGHGLDNNNTQYYQSSRVGFLYFTNYVQNSGGLAGTYVDTDPYPASGCTDFYTPGNCLTDAQIQAEIQKVMTAKGWTGGINKMFLMFTSSGEGSCSGASCAYSDYCAYHSYFNIGTTPVIYGNMPYANPSYCQVPGTPSPNGDAAGDAAANVASHELTEAITDPELNAWYGGDLSHEIGDLCAWNYGTNTWTSGHANQAWPVSFSPFIILGHPQVSSFELQLEYDNHTSSCVELGP